jgi:hypothetical protein
MEKYYYNQDDYSADSRESVNGAWKPLGYSFDGHDLMDKYDNFLTKKSRQRTKTRQDLRKSGLSRKDARKQALAKIPKDKLKDIAKKVKQGAGKTILKTGLVVPRGAYLSLLALNFRGQAWKIMSIVNGRDSKLKDALQKKWEGLGGNFKNLIETAKKGEPKKPFFCGKKCKAKLLDVDIKNIETPKDNFSNAIGGRSGRRIDANTCKCRKGVIGYCGNTPCSECCANYEFSAFTGIEESAIGVWVGLASTIVGAMATITGKAIDSKSQKREIESAERLANQEQANLTKQQEQEIALKEKELAIQGDPTNLILTNPNLTDEERAIALKQLDEAESQGTQRNVMRYALYGGLALLGFYVISKLIKK